MRTWIMALFAAGLTVWLIAGAAVLTFDCMYRDAAGGTCANFVVGQRELAVCTNRVQ